MVLSASKVFHKRISSIYPYQKFSKIVRSLFARALIINFSPPRFILPFKSFDVLLTYIFTSELLENKNDILEELNVKNVRFIDDYEELISINVKPDFQILGQKFSTNMKYVLSKINQISSSDILDIVSDKKINYKIEDDICIDYTDFIVEEISKESFEVSSNNIFKVGINTQITEELKQEGMIRDLIRHVQNFRKESNLEVSDRINISLSANSELELAIKNNKKYFMNEVLGVNIDLNGNLLDFQIDIEIKGKKIKLSLSKEEIE